MHSQDFIWLCILTDYCEKMVLSYSIPGIWLVSSLVMPTRFLYCKVTIFPVLVQSGTVIFFLFIRVTHSILNWYFLTYSFLDLSFLQPSHAWWEMRPLLFRDLEYNLTVFRRAWQNVARPISMKKWLQRHRKILWWYNIVDYSAHPKHI